MGIGVQQVTDYSDITFYLLRTSDTEAYARPAIDTQVGHNFCQTIFYFYGFTGAATNAGVTTSTSLFFSNYDGHSGYQFLFSSFNF
jgi:hypothetical protein